MNTEEVVGSFITSSSKGHCAHQRENDDKCDGWEEYPYTHGRDGYIGSYSHVDLPSGAKNEAH